MTTHATLTITTYFRDSTQEWVGEIAYESEQYGTTGTARYTGATEAETRNAAFDMVDAVFMNLTFQQDIETR